MFRASMALRSGLALVTAASLVASSSQSRSEPEEVLSFAEFPPADWSVRELLTASAAAKLAARGLVSSPNSPETIRLLLRASRRDDVLTGLSRIIDEHPEQIASAFEVMASYDGWRFFRDNTREYKERLQVTVERARSRIAILPREEQARADRQLLWLDMRPPTGTKVRFAEFVQRFAGTEEALLTEVDLIRDLRAGEERVNALDAFAAAHPGTVVAAKALYEKARAIESLARESKGDPTERFFRVLSVATELESGKYPKCQWVDSAPELVSFYVPADAVFSPENLDRVLDASIELARSHLTLDPNDPAARGIGYFLTQHIADLMKRRGDPTPQIERVLSDLARDAADPAAVRYLRARYYMSLAAGASDPDPMNLAKAKTALAAVSNDGRGLYARKALATLATFEFERSDLPTARTHLQRYVREYPTTDWAWVAALRLGQAHERLGDVQAAADAYRGAALSYRSLPVARVLGHEFAARAYERLDRFDRALAEHQRALAAWDNDYGTFGYGTAYSISPGQLWNTTDLAGVARDPWEVSKDRVADRVTQLRQSLATPGGALFERARHLISQKQWSAAIQAAEHFEARYPRSRLSSESRYLKHRSQLGLAVDRAGVAKTDSERNAALSQLDALASERSDLAVVDAKIARAFILWRQGRGERARQSMSEALADWYSEQRISPPAQGLKADVAEIRRVVLFPRPGEELSGGVASEWSGTGSPYVIVKSDVRVRLSTREMTRVTLHQSFGAGIEPLFATSEQVEMLRGIAQKLQLNIPSPRTRPTVGSNQGVSGSDDIRDLWDRFLPEPSPNGVAWDVLTYPFIPLVEFTNPERTRAAAHIVTNDNRGHTVILEKEAGKWVAKARIDEWIS